jgi:ABC-type multidrug transport system ATPase subunit
MVKGISGGEKKRVSIAVEMVAKPGLLILDEPTSGLDSHMAYKLITQLMRLCSREGRTVIFTIHQPSHRIFMCLDRLMVLSRGECVYQGKAKDLLGYMLNLGVTVPAKSTVPDFFMLQISQPKPGSEICATPFTAETYCSSLAPQIQN